MLDRPRSLAAALLALAGMALVPPVAGAAIPRGACLSGSYDATSHTSSDGRTVGPQPRRWSFRTICLSNRTIGGLDLYFQDVRGETHIMKLKRSGGSFKGTLDYTERDDFWVRFDDVQTRFWGAADGPVTQTYTITPTKVQRRKDPRGDLIVPLVTEFSVRGTKTYRPFKAEFSTYGEVITTELAGGTTRAAGEIRGEDPGSPPLDDTVASEGHTVDLRGEPPIGVGFKFRAKGSEAGRLVARFSYDFLTSAPEACPPGGERCSARIHLVLRPAAGTLGSDAGDAFSVNPGSVRSYLWKLSDGRTSTKEDPSFEVGPNAAGDLVYPAWISLTVTDRRGRKATSRTTLPDNP